MRPPSLSRAWRTVSWLRRLSGLTLSPSRASLGVDTWMLSLPASPASRGLRPAPAPGQMTTAGSGRTSLALLATFDPDSSGWKTSRPSLFEADSPSSSLTLPGSGSMQSGRCYARPTWVPRTSGNGSSSWPTAVVTDSSDSARNTTSTGVMHPGTSLNDAIRQHEQMWRTPDAPHGGGVRNRQASRGQGHQLTIAEQAEHWPTPAARDYKGANGEDHLENGTGRKHLDQLPNFVAHLWATPRAEDSEQCGNHPGAQDSLTGQIRMFWPTPTAEQYGSSQNGINGKGGANERPSAATPSLDRMSRSFLPDLPTSTRGDASSPSDPTSRPLWPTPMTVNNTSEKAQHQRPTSGPQRGGPSYGLEDVALMWKTPHGIANMDASGKAKPGLEDQAHTMRKRWPSPTVMDSASFHGEPDTGRTSPNSGKTLAGVAEPPSRKAKLNPRFVEWLMNLPPGWTSVTAWTDSERAAMAWYRCRLRQRLSCWLAEQD